MPATTTRWGVVALVVAAGLVAALQVGKAAIATPMLQADLGLGLAAVGWLTSIFAVLGLVGGIPVGAAVASIGARRVLVAGLLATAAAAAVGAVATAYPLLLATRVVEGAGFLLISVAAPSLLEDVVAPRQRDLAFAFWSCFMPAGIALALLAGPLLGGWHAIWWTSSAVTVLVLLGVLAVVPARAGRQPWSWHRLAADTGTILRAGSPLLLAAAFGLYSLMFFALFSFLPVLLMTRMQVDHQTAGLLSALASAVNILGNLAAGMVLARGGSRVMLLSGANVVMGATGLVIFLALLPDTPTLLLCLVFSAVGGLIPATLLSSTPMAAPVARLTPVVFGLVMQGNNLGQVVGPVAVGSVIDAQGWGAAALIVAGAAVLAVVTAGALARELRRPASP
ncbi:MFS transporter [Reyranella sp. CPCC 100927]|uniref:MFS transporter n=1 Tax=Reyranella sp. CPCC 100927 TaxID=2599616 RepID=UPI0011B6E750|nr:MFS transporter [Reyranella sp. CPCC 100927]TWS97068.1 MFS transporter [Reyranella sp. CPCC 100927]